MAKNRETWPKWARSNTAVAGKNEHTEMDDPKY